MKWRWWCVVVMVVVVVLVVRADTHEEERFKISLWEMRGKELTKAQKEDLPTLLLHPQEITLVKGETSTLQVSLSKVPQGCVNVTVTLEDPLGTITPGSFALCNLTARDISLHTTSLGVTTLTATANPSEAVIQPAGGVFCLVSVMYSTSITIAADVLGWVYTIAWDISFLPQILHNWRRKSVIGLSFDFLTFNLIGFFSYFIFNMGLYWICDIQVQYTLRHPQSILHVRLNDVIFPLYALVCVSLQIVQCFLYERAAGQRVSIPCRVLSGLLVTSAVVGCFLVPLVDAWWWLDVLYLLSYLKLTITCVKYVPQLWVNYKSSSTEGWSIHQVFLDFTGGALSLVQMFLLSANYDDWLSLLTDPAKLGLGLLSIMFNILFFIQHFCLYRNASSSEPKHLRGIDGPFKVEDVALEHTKM